jgi:hypothetical protein
VSEGKYEETMPIYVHLRKGVAAVDASPFGAPIN